ncbi:barstar family protein [Arcicella rigui]|uniref:Barstar family protein n=1 Tax=Arcicella rigui TaxID=797020 RepID=A0ABU5Q5E6_9BACT|nr:barstar family protein [Arcicella rigui]MEA5138061.1 barstar family protein [Arcicella rigui]
MANYILLKDTSTFKPTQKTLVALIDGELTQTTEQFFEKIAESIRFPEYFGHNLDSFDELINDLDWLDENDIKIIFKNYDNFLAEENDEIREIILTVLDDAAEEWKRNDNTKILNIYIEPSELAQEDLETLGISYID